MNIEQDILSELTVYMKYSKYVPELKRRETWIELVNRNKEMHQEKFPQLKDEIETKIEETALKMYQKMKIANTDEIMNLQSQIEIVKKELALAEAKIINLETINK